MPTQILFKSIVSTVYVESFPLKGHTCLKIRGNGSQVECVSSRAWVFSKQRQTTEYVEALRCGSDNNHSCFGIQKEKCLSRSKC